MAKHFYYRCFGNVVEHFSAQVAANIWVRADLSFHVCINFHFGKEKFHFELIYLTIHPCSNVDVGCSATNLSLVTNLFLQREREVSIIDA